MNTRAQGFTLIELAAVLALAGILAALAAPDVSDWLAKRRVQAQAERMQTLLKTAQQEAVRLNSTVFVCTSQVKKDINVDNHCDSRYFGQGFSAWADINGNRFYDGKDKPGSNNAYTTDFLIRSVVINEPEASPKTEVSLSRWQFGGTHSSETAEIFAFFSDGRFRRYQGRSKGKAPAEAVAGGGYTRIAFTQPHQNPERRKHRTAAVWLDSSGNSKICRPNDTGLPCRLEESAQADS
ncbi:MAG: GspH/FimT family pseudopilin [Neisseria sp.]|nr:GspH/FimT family pseudopilin [Neisseria sp.]